MSYNAVAQPVVNPDIVAPFLFSSGIPSCNFAVFSDSYGQRMTNSRAIDGIALSWDPPFGFASLHTAAGNTSPMFPSNQTGTAATYAGDAYIEQGTQVTDDVFNGGFYPGCPYGGITQIRGGTGYTAGAADRFLNWRFNNTFSAGVITNWISAISGWYYSPVFWYQGSSLPNSGVYMQNCNFGTGATNGTLVGAQNLTTAFDGAAVDGLLQRLGARILLDTSADANIRVVYRDTGNELLAATRAVTYVAMGGGVVARWVGGSVASNLHTGGTLAQGLSLAAFGTASQAYADHANAGTASAVVKRGLNREYKRQFQCLFPDQNRPWVISILMGPETGDAATQAASVNAILNRMKGILTVGLGLGDDSDDDNISGMNVTQPIVFLLIGCWATGDGAGVLDPDSTQQQDVFYTVCRQRSDTAFVSLYGLLGGIVFGNIADSGQVAWATARGWNAWATNGGAVDMSTKDCLDSGELHPADDTSIAFFMRLVRNALYPYRNGWSQYVPGRQEFRRRQPRPLGYGRAG